MSAVLDLEKLGAEARAYFHRQTGYCATPRARAKAAYLARQEENRIREIEQKRKFALKRPRPHSQTK